MEAVSALHMIGLNISAQADVPTVLQGIIKTAIELIPTATGGSIWLYDPARGELVLTSAIGDSEQYIGSTMRPGEGLGGRVFNSGKAMAVDDYRNWEHRTPRFDKVNYRSVMCIPLHWHDEIIGILNLSSSVEGSKYSPDDIQLAELFASQAAIAIGNVRLLEATTRRIEQLDTLRNIAVELLATTDVKHILGLIAKAALNHARGQDVHLYLYDQATGELTFGTSLWADGTRDQEYSPPRPDGITMTVARTGKRVLVVDPRHDPMFAGASGQWDAIAAFVSVPFRRGDEVLGVFNIAFDKQTVLDRGLLNFLDLLAAQAAVAIYNVQLFSAAERRAEESDRLRTVAVEILSSTDISSILQRIGQEAVEHCRADDVRIYLYDQANDRLTFGAGLEAGIEDNYPPRPAGLTAIVARTGERMVVTDPQNHPLFANHVRQDNWQFDSVVGVPLKRGSEVIGVLNAIFKKAINAETLRFLDLLAAQAAVAIQNARLFAATAHRAEEYGRLRAAALALLSANDMSSMMAAIAHAAVAGVNANYVYIYQYDQVTDTFQLGASLDAKVGETIPEHAPPRSGGLTATVARSGERITVVNPASHPMFANMDVTATWRELHTIVGLPLKDGDRVIGVMNVFFADRVGEEVLTFLDLLAAQGVVGFQNMKLYDAERAARTRADAVLNAALTLSSTLSLGDLLRVILDECAKVLPIVTGAILIYDEDNPSVVALHGFEGHEGEVIELFHTALKDHPIHQRMKLSRRPYIIADVTKEPDWLSIDVSSHIRSWMGLPLIARGDVIGAVVLDSDKVNAFTPQHADMAQGLASHAAVAIENARLLNRTHETIAQLEAFFDASRSLITASSPDDLLRAIAAPALATGQANAALVYIDTDDQGRAAWGEVIAATQEAGGPKLPDPGTHFRALDLPLGRFYRRYPNRVIAVPRIDMKRTHNRMTIGLLESIEAQAMAYIPLTLGERLVGLICLLWSEPHEFPDEEIQFYQVLSPQLAAVVDNRRLFETTRYAQERFRDIALSTSDWLWETDARGRVTFCTERIVASLGYTPQDYIGRTFYEYMQADEATRVRNIINAHAAERRPIEGMEYWALHRDGHRVDLSTSAVPILDDRRGVVGFRGVSKDITEQKRAEQRERLAYEMGQRMTSVLSLDELTKTVVDQLHQVFGYYPASLFFFDEASQSLIMQSESAPEHRNTPLKLDHQPSLVAMAARSRVPVVSNNTNDDPNYLEIEGLGETRSEAAFPLVRGDVLLGVLDVQSHQPGRFSPAEVRALQNLAAHLAIAIENARLYEAERAARNRGDALREAARVLSSTLSLDEVLESILKQCAVVVPYTASTIVIFEDKRPILAATAGDLSVLRMEQQKLDQIFEVSPILSRILITQQPVIIPDVRGAPDWIHVEGEERVRCWMGVPMQARDSLVGILMLYGDAEVRFTAEHLDFTQGLATHAALAIENARLYRALERQASHLEDLVEDRTAEVVRQQERLKAIVESAGEAIIFTGPDGLVEFTNPAWERLTGLESHFVLGKHVAQFMGNATSEVYEGISQTMRLGKVWEGEIHARRPDGSEYDAAVTAAPVLERGELVNVVGVIRDVSATKEVERMRRKFVHNISHELRTPITNLKLFHALVRSGPPARREEYLDTIAGELSRLERLIEDLLDISQLDQGVLSMRPALIDLNQIVQEVQRAHLLRAEERGLHLEIDLYDALPNVTGDRVRITQVIVNLLTNAINYTNSGDRIGVKTYLTVRDEQPTVALKVWDTGIGIAPQDLPFIFNRFFRAETAKVEGIPGTGLGLSIVKEIIEMHDGHVQAESEKGKGTTFTFFLPVAQMGEAQKIAEPRNPL